MVNECFIFWKNLGKILEDCGNLGEFEKIWEKIFLGNLGNFFVGGEFWKKFTQILKF